MSTTQMSQTTYGFGVTVDLPYDEAIERTKAALKEEGFGVLTEIDVRKTLKEKIDADFEPYIILGACNPGLAHRALLAEHEIGLLLPCNVIVHDDGDGRSKVSVMDPNAAMGLVESDAVAAVAAEAREKLQRALEALQK
ncbi:MAG TPA: DUF302 domain-containing protein [Thermomicrobiales bacterium]|nr:DUF302 domain-containing protein [Thermomicrobiales bacterium]